MSTHETNLTRRKVVGGISVAAATLASGKVGAGSQAATTTEVAGLQDPIGKYPAPPFKSQTQTWPGLASKMQPPPDHGEQSYRGSGRLLGRKALITGGDSGMGRAAAIAYPEHDPCTAASSRDVEGRRQELNDLDRRRAPARGLFAA